MASFYIAYLPCPYSDPTRLCVPVTQITNSMVMNGTPSGAPYWNGAYYNMLWVTANSDYSSFNVSDSWVSDQSWAQNQYSYVYAEHPEVYSWAYLGTASSDDFSDQIPSIRPGYPVYFYGPWRGPGSGGGGDNPDYPPVTWSQSHSNDYEIFETSVIYYDDQFVGTTYPVVAGRKYLIRLQNSYIDCNNVIIVTTGPHQSSNNYWNWSDVILHEYNADAPSYEPTDYSTSDVTYTATEDGIIYIYLYANGGYEDDNPQYVILQIRERRDPEFSLGPDVVNYGGTAYIKYKSKARGKVRFTSGDSGRYSVYASDTYQPVSTDYDSLKLTTVGSKTFTAWFEPDGYRLQTNDYAYYNSPSSTATIRVLPPPVTITLDMNGGGSNTTVDVVPETAIGEWSIDTIPTRTGFNFLGFWDTSNYSEGEQYIDETGEGVHISPATAYTLYARWKPVISYTTTSSTFTVYCTTSNSEASVTEGSQQITISSGGSSASGLSITYTDTGEGWTISSDGKKLTIPNGLSPGSYSIVPTASIVASNTTHNTASSTSNTIVVNIQAVTKYPDNTNPQKYKNTSGTTGYNIVYNTPSCTLTNSLTAAGGTVKVVCTVTNSTNWYWKYTNNTYSAQQTGTEAGTARWRITSNGNSRFSHPSSGASNLVIGGSTYDTYATGTSATHSNMTTNVATDTVKITSYNIGDTSKASSAKSASISNTLTSVSLSVAKSTISYNTTTTCTTTASYTSGSTKDVTSDSGTTYTTNPTGIVTIS